MGSAMISEQKVKLLNNRKKRALLLNSESSKQYPNLIQWLEQYEEFSEEVAAGLSQEDIVLVEHMLPNIIHLCEDEWRGDEVPFEVLSGKEGKPCQLCGYPDTKKIFYIRNVLNGKTLNVGSTCITEFVSLDKLRIGKTKSQLEKQGKRNLRLRQLNERYPGIQEVVTNWLFQLDTFEVLIPTTYSNPYIQLGEQLKDAYERYLDSKFDDIDGFAKWLQKQKVLLQQMHEYTLNHFGKPFVVSRNMVQWLKQNQDDVTLKAVSHSGYVDHTTVGKIWEEEFIKVLIPLYQEKLTRHDIHFEGIEDNQLRIRINKPLPIMLHYHVDKFIRIFGVSLFNAAGAPKLIPYNILYSGSVLDMVSKKAILFELHKKLRRFGYRLKFEDKKDQYFLLNELDIIHKESNQVMVVKLSDFINKYKMYILQEKDVRDVVKDIQNMTERKYAEKQLREIRSTRKDVY